MRFKGTFALNGYILTRTDTHHHPDKDYAARIRVRYFTEYYFSMNAFKKHHLGPILFTEENYFQK